MVLRIFWKKKLEHQLSVLIYLFIITEIFALLHPVIFPPSPRRLHIKTIRQINIKKTVSIIVNVKCTVFSSQTECLTTTIS